MAAAYSTAQQYGNYRRLANHTVHAHVNPYLSERWPHTKDEDRIFEHDPGPRTGRATKTATIAPGGEFSMTADWLRIICVFANSPELLSYIVRTH